MLWPHKPLSQLCANSQHHAWHRLRLRPRRRCCGLLPLLCIAMLLITFALATWALVEGVHGTHHKVDNFWAIEESIRNQVQCWRYSSLILLSTAHKRRLHEATTALAASHTIRAVLYLRRSPPCGRMSSPSSAA